MTTLTLDDLRQLSIANATEDEISTVRRLLAIWHDRLEKNQKRTLYYDGEQAFKDLGLALPPQLKNAKFCLGWGAMAVRKAAVRSQFQGLRLPGTDDPFELDGILEQNSFALELGQSVVSGYKHGVSFVTVAEGGPGDPDVQILAHSAETSSAIWDRRTRSIGAALTISDLDKDGKPTEMVVYLRDVILWLEKSGSTWTAERIPNATGRVQVVPVGYDPQLTQPFGRSRISDPVMSLTDMAVRTYVRMEGNAEFYSSPQIAIEGIDEDAFDGSASEQRKFKLAMDRLIALTRDEDGNAPSIKQLQQATMTPHSDMLRTVAMAFTGETGIPPHSLGIIHDNPSSAEAIRAAEHDLLIDVTYQNNLVLANAVKQIARLAIMVRDGLTEAPAEAMKLTATFADPEFRSTSANADAVMKLSTLPQLQGSNVILEKVFTPDEIERIESEQRRASGTALLERLREQPAAEADSEQSDSAPESSENATLIKAQFDALGGAIRAGVDPEDAATRVGLPGIRFTGAIPVALRPPKDDAQQLEDK